MVGFISLKDRSELSLWRPFGERRVAHVLPGDDLAALAGRHMDVLVVQGSGLAQQFHKTLPQLLTETGGSLVGQEQLTVQVSVGTEDWFVVSLRR